MSHTKHCSTKDKLERVTTMDDLDLAPLTNTFPCALSAPARARYCLISFAYSFCSKDNQHQRSSENRWRTHQNLPCPKDVEQSATPCPYPHLQQAHDGLLSDHTRHRSSPVVHEGSTSSTIAPRRQRSSTLNGWTARTGRKTYVARTSMHVIELLAYRGAERGLGAGIRSRTVLAQRRLDRTSLPRSGLSIHCGTL